MKEELEARERGGTSSVTTGGKRKADAGQEMDAEIRKLAEEGKRRRMEMQSKMDAAEAAASPTPELKPQPVAEKVRRERTPQTAQEEAEEEDEVARLERRIREISEAKEKRRAERKARKSGVFVRNETPSASPQPESKSDEPRKFNPDLSAKFTPCRPMDDITSVLSPKFSFSPKPRTAPAAGNDEFAATVQRLKEAEKKRLEEEIRKQEAETPM